MKKIWTIADNTNHSVFKENGNVLVYVLLAVVLFGALSFTLSRQANNAGTTELDSSKLEFYATKIISYTVQTKSVIDQMMITGSSIDDIDFTKPGESGYNTAPHTHKIYHPQGGGLDVETLPEEITLSEKSEDPDWYLTSSMNVEWTDSTSTDIVLTAYQINEKLCDLLNKKITSSETIPLLSGQMKNYFINTEANNDLDTSVCNDCEGYSVLCVSNGNQDSYSFYSVLADR